MARMKKNLIVRLIIGTFLGVIIGLMLEKNQLQEMEGKLPSLAYVLGIVSGILCGFLIVALFLWLVRKLGGKVDWRHNGVYDERQLLARGQAYKAAYSILAGYMIIIALLDNLTDFHLFMSFGGVWIGICLSILVFTVICIIKDAYMSLYENAKGITMLLFFVAFLNLGIGCWNFWHGMPLLENGEISVTSINMAVGMLFFVISIVFCGKVVYNKKHLEEDEE